MVGRVDDQPRIPAYLEWAGVGFMRNAYRTFEERGYRTRLLVAAYRNLSFE